MVRLLITAALTIGMLAAAGTAHAAPIQASYPYGRYSSGSGYGYQYTPQAPAGQTSSAIAAVGSMQMSSWEWQVVSLVNAARTKAGLKPLRASAELSRVARFKSADMRDRNYFSHQSPAYGSPFQMIRNFGVSYRTAGENIAAGQRTPQEVMNAWMNSSGHRANILNPNYTHVGIGTAGSSRYGLLFTQMFIAKP